jgi:TPR repeat protein
LCSLLSAHATLTLNRYAPSHTADLGVCYHHGEGVAVDTARALELYEDAAARNDSRALLTLAELYESGGDAFGVAVDEAKALELFVAAADQVGSITPRMSLLKNQTCLVPLLPNTHSLTSFVPFLTFPYLPLISLPYLSSPGRRGRAVSPGRCIRFRQSLLSLCRYNQTLTLDFLCSLTYQGDEDALFRLGGVYESGRLGVAVDGERAVEWYRSAAQADHDDAIARLEELREPIWPL